MRPSFEYPQAAAPARTTIPTARAATPRVPAGPPWRPAPEAWWGTAATWTVAGSLAVVTALWAANSGIGDLAGVSRLTSLGRLLGLLAADLLLVQVLLMARIPWLERVVGQDTLARWHRLVGFTSFDLMMAHVVLIILGYAAEARTGVLAQAWDLVTSYPGMLLATAATALLVMVAVTSMRAARRKLRYESWHLLHLYAYLGVGLALPHQVWTGSAFVGSPLARAYWWTLYGATLAAVVVFRLAVPVWRNLRHRLVVEAVVPEGPGVVSVHLRGRHVARMGVQGGQFFLWRFVDGPGWSRAHPYSLSAAPRPDRMRITVKELGDDSRALAGLRPGSRALVEGPFGRLTADARRAPGGVTLIGSGIGITPLRAVLEELDVEPGQATLLYRASTPDDFVFRRELDWFAANRGVRVVYLPGHRAARRSWLPAELAHVPDDEALSRLAPAVAWSDVYVCGPDEWMDAVRDAALAAGVPAEHLHLERFTW
ncbi:MAG: ferric reductase-like transmembrane domain-containing protein [Acidimicrobiales bacterium]